MNSISPRGAAAAVFLLALVVASLTDRPSERAPRRVGDEWLLEGDFHVHAFPGDGSLAPWALRDAAVHAGLDVIAITNHNQLVAARIAPEVFAPPGPKTPPSASLQPTLSALLALMPSAALQPTPPAEVSPIILVGQEITHRDYHIAAVGLTRKVNPNQSAAATIHDVHAQGGVAIAAHPTRDFVGFDTTAMAALDGAEIAHPAMHNDPGEGQDFAEFFRRARASNPDLAPIGSSDFHATPSLGRCRTYLLARERSASGVLDAIRRGRTVALDGDGRLHGDADLIDRMARATPPAGPDARQARWPRLSVTLTWLALVTMLLVPSRRFDLTSRRS